MVALLLLVLSLQAISGLVLAGTDIYFPPFGNTVQQWIKKEGVGPETPLIAGSKANIDQEKYKEMRRFRKPFIETHKIIFYLLLFLIPLHIFAVVVTEARERNGLVSALFTGRKIFSKKPVDLE